MKSVLIAAQLCVASLLLRCTLFLTLGLKGGMPTTAAAADLFPAFDQAFRVGGSINGPVNFATQQTNGAVLVAGSFTSVAGNPRVAIARLKTDGTLDETFVPNLLTSSSDALIVVLPDDKILVAGGNLSSTQDPFGTALIRLHPNGQHDTNFILGNPNRVVMPTINCIAVDSEQRILVGGGGVEGGYVARFLSNGAPDLSFPLPLTIPSGEVRALALQTNGLILIGGRFTNIAGSQRLGLARLNSGGVLDLTFAPAVVLGQSGGFPIEPSIDAIALQPDGRILVGGNFSEINGSNRFSIARLEPDGTLDSTFVADATTGFTGSELAGRVRAISALPDGKILIGGIFNRVNGIARYGVARLLTNGALDHCFDAGELVSSFGYFGSLPTIRSVCAQPDRQILIGGEFASWNSNAMADTDSFQRLARIRPEPCLAIENIRAEGGAEIELLFAGPGDASISLEATTNLMGWFPVQTWPSANTNTVARYTNSVPTSTVEPFRGFRLRIDR